MARIIISYRRSDSDVFAGRIRDRIASRYGDSSVFMDIDDIPFGKDFRQHIKDALTASDAVVVIIGPRWLGTAKGGQTRIQEETDPVRIEVETALQRNIPIVPVLVGDTKMPKPSQLPAALKDFAFINAAPVDTGRDFHPHMQRLLRQLDQILGIEANHSAEDRSEPPHGAKPKGWPRELKIGLASLVLLILAAAGLSQVSPLSMLFPTGPALQSSATRQDASGGKPRADTVVQAVPATVSGIDCDTTKSLVERTICADPELASRYKLVLDLDSLVQSRWPADEQLKAARRSWQDALRACETKGEQVYGCIKNTNEARIGQLQKGPSYPCHEDKNRVEQAICRDALLSTKDQALHEAYHLVIDEMKHGDYMTTMRVEQLKWISTVRDVCDEPGMVVCINRVYDSRLKELDQLAQQR